MRSRPRRSASGRPEEAPAVDAAALLEEAAVIPADEWAETYPNEYETWSLNSENAETVDYLEEYPYLNTLYAGNAFSKDYLSARGHAYTLEDVSATLRAPALANCLSCKTPTMNALISSGEVGVYALPFEDVLALSEESVGCYSCHANTGDQLMVTNTFLNDGVGDDVDSIDPSMLACGQCHNEYYFDPDTKATMLPHDSVESMSPDAILAYYDEIGFSDYTDPQTGVEFIKVQHPELETVMGEGFKMVGYTCADCHMGTATDDEGNEYTSHYFTSPLDNAELLENNCSACHEDLAAEVEAIQTAAEERTERDRLQARDPDQRARRGPRGGQRVRRGLRDDRPARPRGHVLLGLRVRRELRGGAQLRADQRLPRQGRGARRRGVGDARRRSVRFGRRPQQDPPEGGSARGPLPFRAVPDPSPLRRYSCA